MPDPPTPRQEKADKEKRDARVVDERLEAMLRLYVVPVEKDADGKAAGAQADRRGLQRGRRRLGRPDSTGRPTALPSSSRTSPRRYINDWPRTDVSVVDVATRHGAAPGRHATRRSPIRIFSPDGRSVAYDLTNDPPTWREQARVAVVAGRAAARRGCWRETHDGQPDLVGWLEGRPRAGDGDVAAPWAACARCPRTAARPWFVSPEDVMVTAPAAQRARARTSAFMSQAPDRAGRGLRRRAADASRPCRSSRAQEAARSAAGPDGDAHLEVARRQRGRGPADLSGRLRGRQPRAAAGDRARRPGRRVHAHLHRRRLRRTRWRLRGPRATRSCASTRAAAAATASTSATRTTATGAAATTATSCPAWTR